MRRRITLLAVLIVTRFSVCRAAQHRLRIVVIRIQLTNEAITPVTARFISTAIRQAEEQRAAALILLTKQRGGS